MKLLKTAGGEAMTQTNMEKKQEVEKIMMIYQNLSERGKLMLLAYSAGIRDKELAEEQR